MPWFKIDDGFHGHPKVMELSPAAVGVWTLSGTWCASYLTDGEIKLGVIRRLGGTPEMIQELVDAGLWIDNGGSYQFKDWEDYQPMKADVEAEREAARERMRAARAKKKGVECSTEPEGDVRPNNTGTFEGTSEEVRVTPAQPSPSRPVPSPVVVNRRKVERPLPEGWAPTEAHKAYANEQGINLDFQAERFTSWAQAKDVRYRDWDAAFRNWLLKAEKSTTTKNALWD